MDTHKARVAAFLIATAVLLPATQAQVPSKIAIQTEYFAHPDDPKKKIEVLWAKPATPTPSPAIVFIHGHQEPERPGANVYVGLGVLEQRAAEGYVAIAVSQPGYGGSDGPSDFCGPFTQRAVLHVIEEFRRRAFVRSDKIAIIGVSRGANVAGMVAAQDHKLAAVVLVSGLFDMARIFDIEKRSAVAQRVGENFRQETNGAGELAIKQRSVLAVADNIKTPTLILNGAQDDRTDPDGAKQLAARIAAHGTPAEVVIYPDFGHNIPNDARRNSIEPFLHRYVKP